MDKNTKAASLIFKYAQAHIRKTGLRPFAVASGYSLSTIHKWVHAKGIDHLSAGAFVGMLSEIGVTVHFGKRSPLQTRRSPKRKPNTTDGVA